MNPGVAIVSFAQGKIETTIRILAAFVTSYIALAL